jgi:hypothetical protein
VAWRWWCLLFLLVSARASAAAPAGYALHWVRAKGAERCIDPKALAERVETLTGPVFSTPAQAEISLEGEIAPAGRGFRVRLVSTRADGVQRGERILSTNSPDCHQLDAAVAFVIALTIDPGLSLAGVPADVLGRFAQELPPEQVLLAELAAQSSVAPGTGPDILEAAPAPAAVPVLEKEQQKAPRALRPPRYTVGLAAATLGLSLPSWSFGVRGTFGFDHPRLLPLVLSVSAFPGAASHAINAGLRASFQQYDAALTVCPGLRWNRWSANGCLGLALGYLRAQGSGSDSDDSDGQGAIWDPALVLGVTLAVSLWRGLGLSADAMLRVRLTDQDFEFTAGDNTKQSAYDPSRVGLLFSLGPRYEF